MAIWTSRARRRLARATMVLAAAAVMGALIVALAAEVLPVFADYSCSRAGQRILQSQESFVRERLPDASGFAVHSYDCDSGTSAFLGFSTGLSPDEAVDRLLSDFACELASTDADGPLVRCRSGDRLITVHLTAEKEGGGGELELAGP